MSDPATTRQQLKQYALHAFLEASALFAILKALAWYTVLTLPAGRQFVFETLGMGLLYDAATRIFLLTGFFILYTVPSLSVRKSLGCFLQGLMFFLLIFMVAFIDCRQYIAVVETPNAFLCFRIAPFGHDTLLKNQLAVPDVHDTGTVRYLRFDHSPHHVCKPVWHRDAAANRTLDDLIAALANARH